MEPDKTTNAQPADRAACTPLAIESTIARQAAFRSTVSHPYHLVALQRRRPPMALSARLRGVIVPRGPLAQQLVEQLAQRA